MPQVLSYADGHAGSRVRHEAGPRGGRIIVPARRATAAFWAMLGGGAFLFVAGCGLGLGGLGGFADIGALVAVAGAMLFMGSAVQIVLPGSEPAAVFAYSDDPGGGGRVLTAEVFLAGDPLPQRHRWEPSQIEDVRVGFARGFDEDGHPAMELRVTAAGRAPVGLVPPRRDPRTLHAVAALLRGVLRLPPPRAARVAWLRTQASRREPLPAAAVPNISAMPSGTPARGEMTPRVEAPPSDLTPRPPGPPPLPRPAVPVLAYHEPPGTAIGPMLDRADLTPDRMALTLAEHDGFHRAAVRVELTPDRLAIGWGEAHAFEWPCDGVLGVYVDFPGPQAPAELCVYAAGGPTRLLAGARDQTLRDLAALLNGALGIPGSVY